MKTVLLAVVLGLAACGGTEQRLPDAAGNWSFSTVTASIRMTLVQAENGTITGTATRLDSGTQGGLIGNINGPENVSLRMTFTDAAVVQIQAAGLPVRMFGTVYVNSEGTHFEATRN
jgi:hypothetical protein